jgi:DNA-binding Lrp family transcriptional regulator
MISKKSLRILESLRKNCRKKLTSISKELDIPVSTIFDNLKSFERNGLVEHKALLNFKKMGYPFHVVVAIKADIRKEKDLKEYLALHKNINSIFKIDGDGDYLIEAVFQNYREYSSFITNIDLCFDLVDKSCYQIENVLQREDFLCKGKNPL